MRRIILSLICLLSYGWPSVAAAQSEQPAATGSTTQSITGTVVSSDERTLVVLPENGTEVSLQIDPNAYLPTHITTGQRIMVQYTTDEQNVRRVSYASILPASGPAATGTPAPASAAAPMSASTPEMPATASPLWWFAVIGAAAASASLGARLHRR